MHWVNFRPKTICHLHIIITKTEKERKEAQSVSPKEVNTLLNVSEELMMVSGAEIRMEKRREIIQEKLKKAVE